MSIVSRHRHHEIDPTDPKHWSYVPNHWSNRRRLQQYGEAKNAASVLPSQDSDEDWSYDHESHLKRGAQVDMFGASILRVDIEARKRFHPRAYCKVCDPHWRDGDAPPKPEGAKDIPLPPGAASREACDGCIFSFYDVRAEDLSAERDRAFTAWAAAKDRIAELEFRKRDAQTPGEKELWARDRRRASDRLKEAAEECRLVGIEPMRRKRVKKFCENSKTEQS